jgi:Family of unknown function (DUF5996)
MRFKLMNDEMWPTLPVTSWRKTYETLHMLTQIVGKIRLAATPKENHWWNSTLYVTPSGLTTSVMYHNDMPFKIEFDLNKDFLIIEKAFGYCKKIPLESRPVADYYRDIMSTLESIGISLSIWSTPVEVENGIPFEKDYVHSTYDGNAANKFWRILTQSSRLFTEFRSRFLGKVSPVHFFWGAFDLAVTRFSGRGAPVHPGVPNCPKHVMVEAYSHEVSSCGLWPGGGPFKGPVYYSYSYPEPQGFKEAQVKPAEAYYESSLGEFILPYEIVRTSESPDESLLSFLQSTYEAAARAAKWERNVLERQ